MTDVSTVIVNRAGEFVASSEDDKHLPITVAYLERVFEHMKSNRAYYIDIELAQRDLVTLRSMFTYAKRSLGYKISTFKVIHAGRDYLGFVKTEIRDFDVIV